MLFDILQDTFSLEKLYIKLCVLTENVPPNNKKEVQSFSGIKLHRKILPFNCRCLLTIEKADIIKVWMYME